MELAIILLPVMAFIALAAGLIVVFRGTARIAARTREINQFRGGVRALAAQIDVALEAAVGRIDAVRHHQASPDLINETVVEATDALERFGEVARSLRGPRRAQAVRDDLVAELERANRALGMVEHGANILASSRRGSRDLEAQTSIKRGYLNLIHAREAIARQAIRADQMQVDERPPARTGFGA